MEIEILGSGAAYPTPRPGCACRLCRRAREDGAPHARCGPCVFVHGPDLLIDTPEEVRLLLDRAGLGRVGACTWSHWHPDHTAGWRVWEAVGADPRGWPPAPVATRILLPEGVARDFDLHLGLGESLRYLEGKGIVAVEVLDDGGSAAVGDARVTPVSLAEPGCYAFLVEDATSRILVAMDETKGWVPTPELMEGGLDLAVLPTAVFELDPFTGRRRLAKDHPLLRSEATWEDTVALARTLGARHTVFAHIEEADGNTVEDLKRLAARLGEEGLDATFAWDGLRLEAAADR